jgi:hypothetical protein
MHFIHIAFIVIIKISIIVINCKIVAAEFIFAIFKIKIVVIIKTIMAIINQFNNFLH